MSSEVLREAARLMREKAKAAVCPCGGPMCNVEKGWFHEGELRARFEDTPGDSVPHVLAWSPAVALAVADSLEEAAAAFDNHMAKQMDPLRRFHGLWLAEAERKHERALAVARAYLNEVPS